MNLIKRTNENEEVEVYDMDNVTPYFDGEKIVQIPTLCFIGNEAKAQSYVDQGNAAIERLQVKLAEDVEILNKVRE